MKIYQTISALVAMVVFATIAISFGTRSSNSHQDSSKKQNNKRQEDRSKYPIADYEAPESEHEIRRKERKLKNKRYDNRSSSVSKEPPVDDGEENSLFTHSESAVGLPASESEIVVVGKVLDAQAYISNNKQGVYSEFTFRVDEILKTNSTNITQNSLINVDREGGFVLYKNGKKRLHRIAGFGMPSVGRRYVLFLKNPEKSLNYEIITGYELSADGIANLDGFPQFSAYRGMNETAFMKAVREAISQSSQAMPEKEK
ncbi:MAG TPA: hypothetical protein VF571_15350 [Pyrinomonadaceae bacterium]|jgi:hypothetical protein